MDASTAAGQRALCTGAERNAFEVNKQFLWFVEHGMTREDLQANIIRRPLLWARFDKWLDKLPSRADVKEPVGETS